MDITTLKQAESEKQRYQQELSHVARLSTIGELATSMAHELNQPLAALVSYCNAARTLLNSLPSPPPQLCEILESAETQAHRASDIIRHLRHFVRKGNNHREFLELDRLIHAIISFLKIEAQSNNIKIEFYPDCHNCRVEVNKVQIDQVLVNIVRNSIEAIRSAKMTNGRIVCRTALLANDSIEVTVSDNGPGIDAAMVEVIFDPFQTSKREGMGLGLSLSRSIIEAHGGSLWVDKCYRGGALFGFRLPTSE